MSMECRQAVVEIDAAAGEELPPDVLDHVASCASCAKRRAQSLLMTRITEEAEISPEVAVALARSALSDSGQHRTALWAAPLLSASVSVATLILYFGLALPPSSNGEDRVGESSSTTVEQRVSSVRSLAVSSELPLPDSFQAFDGLLGLETQEEVP